MKLTKNLLRNLIREEISRISESDSYTIKYTNTQIQQIFNAVKRCFKEKGHSGVHTPKVLSSYMRNINLPSGFNPEKHILIWSWEPSRTNPDMMVAKVSLVAHSYNKGKLQNTISAGRLERPMDDNEIDRYIKG